MNIHLTKKEGAFYFENIDYQKAVKEQQQNRSGANVDATGLALAENILGDKQVAARKQALKAKLDVFEKDSSLDKEVSERANHMDDLRQTALDAGEQMKNIDENLKNLEESGFGQDSQEYQEMAAQRQEWSSRVDEAKQGIISDAKAQQAVRINRVKDHSMVDAQKESENIMANAAQESIQDIVKDGVDNINDMIDDMTEVSDDKEDSMQQVSDDKDDLEREMNQMMAEKKITEEDLLGLAVDKSL